MRYQSTVFGQLLKALPRRSFERLARVHATGRKKRELSDWGHLVAMIFAQAQGRAACATWSGCSSATTGSARIWALAK